MLGPRTYVCHANIGNLVCYTMLKYLEGHVEVERESGID